MESGIVFRDVRARTKVGLKRETKEILHGVCGTFPSGKLIGILGPSGSGKTTLLNILSGCIRDYDGNVQLNFESSSAVCKTKEGSAPDRISLLDEDIDDDDCQQTRNIKNDPENFTMGYIQQETHLCGLLTVEETFELAADLKLPQKELHEKRVIILDLINTLRLNNVLKTRVCCISGGERKRLAIGLELLSDYSVILIDEPTTGLDSISTQICIEHFKHLTTNGKTIVCTIHQPSASILDKFDYLYILADGYCLYEGTTSKMLQVLAEYNMECPCFHNPADFIIEIASGDYGTNQSSIKAILIDRYHQERYIESNSKITSNKVQKTQNCRASSITQLKTLLKREYLKALRNPTLTYLRLITSITNSLILCAIFWKVGNDGSKVWFNYNAILGFVLQLMTPSLMLTILTFPTEFAILKREQINRWYSLEWYYAAITLIDLPISIIYCFNSNVIFYYLTEQPLESWRFSVFSLLGFLICIIAQSLGLLVGSIFNVVNGTFIGSALSFPLMMFAGFGVTFKDIPGYIKWMGHFSYLKYGVEGMAGSVMGFNRSALPCPDDSYCLYKDSERFLDDMGVEGHQLAMDFYVLIGFFVFLRILTYVTLKARVSC